MGTDFWEYAARRPRHQASDHPTRVLLRDIDATEDQWQEAELGDVSRNGLRLLRAPDFAKGDRVHVTIPFEQDWLNKTQLGTIRWRRETEDGCELACEFDTPIDWEVIGELILTGALETKPRSEDD